MLVKINATDSDHSYLLRALEKSGKTAKTTVVPRDSLVRVLMDYSVFYQRLLEIGDTVKVQPSKSR